MIIFKLGKWSLVATLCMLAQLVAAQDYPLFLVDSIGLFGVPVAGSAHWLGADCSTEAYTLASPYVEDVSIAPNGFVYGIGYSINSGVDALYEVETTGAPNYWGSLGIVQFTDVAQVYKGLACDSLSQVYLAGDRLARYHNGNLQELGNFPPGMECQGDLCFRYGKLYMSTVSHQLLEVNPANPGASTIVMDFPAWAPPIDALATVKVDCNSVITYAIGRGTGVSKLYEIDFQNQSLIEICELPKTVVGLASPTEALPPPCAITLDLDADDQTGAEFPNIYLDTTCLPVVAYGNYSILLESEIGYIDSIQIHLAGIMDIGFEVLSFPQTTGIGIQNNNSPSITLYNEGAATPNDFAQLLSLLLYENAQPNYSFGTRTVGMTAFANIYQSETAYAYLTLSNAALILNAVISPPSCFASSDGSIELNPLGGTTPYQYQWNTGADAGVLLNLEAGAYSCTLSDDQGCWKSEDFYLTAPDSLIVELLGPSNNQVCGAIGTLVPLVTGGMPAYQFEWLSGQQDSVLSGLGAGNYQLTVSDQNGCQAFADLDLVADTILLEVSENRCVGDTYFYQGIPLTVDTSFCISAQTVQGCDSSYCLNLQFIDTSLTFIEQSICQGESVVFDGTAYSEDTYLQISYSNILGCDSTVIFDLEVLENQTNLDLSICAGESYYFNGTALEEAGLYYDTLTAFNGCDSLLLLDLSILPPPTPEIVPNGHFCTDDSIELSAGTFTGYHWSLNSLSTSSINVTTPGIYSLTVTDVNGCSASTSLDVPAPETLGVQYTVDPIACFGESTAQITITGITGGQAPYYYALNNGSPQTVPVFESLSSGNFLLQVMDANGCTGSSQIQIDNPAPLYLYVREDTVVQLGNPILLKAVTNIVNPSVHWTPETSLSCSNCLSTMAAPSTTTTYSVVVTNAQGCQIAEEVTINVNDELRIYTPNAFSPNGDGVNDCFFLQSNFDYLLLELSIFDRWGNLVFQQHDLPINDPAAGWCGRSDQSEPTIPGNFVWLAKVQNLNGEVVVLKGGITLLR